MEVKELNQQKSSVIEEYDLVDFAARYQKGFRNNVIPIGKVPELVRKYKQFECYITLFFYNEEILDYMKKNIRDSKASVAGYKRKVWAPFLVFDIDSQNLKQALQVSREIVAFYLKYWELSQESLLVYFSGSAGFHILLDTRIFGRIEPSENLHLVFSELRKRITIQAKVKRKEAVDYVIKDKVRLFRIVNTINAKSGLYKVQLSLDELFKYEIKDIQNKAKKTQPMYFTDRTGFVSTEDNVKECEEAKEMFQYALDEVRIRKSETVVMKHPIGNVDNPSEILCEARKRIWNSHIEKGYRNNAAVRLVSQFRLSGFSKEKSIKLIVSWNKNNSIDLPLEELLKSVESAYNSAIPYDYGCNDEIIKEFCPFTDKRKCENYRSFIKNKVKNENGQDNRI